MDTQSAFERGVRPVLEILLRGREESLSSIPPDAALHDRIETLAEKSTEGELTNDERAEYEGYVQANTFLAMLRRAARPGKPNPAP